MHDVIDLISYSLGMNSDGPCTVVSTAEACNSHWGLVAIFFSCQNQER